MTGREQGWPEGVQTAEELIAVDPSRMTMGMAQVLLLLEERDRLRAALELMMGCADWYRRNLEDVIDRRPVRGLDEARAGFDSALRRAQETLDGVSCPERPR